MSEHTKQPIYYAEGQTIWKSPIETPNDDGSKNISLGFPVCTVSEYVSSEDLKDFFNRAEACIRACAGIPTEQLEKGSVAKLDEAARWIVAIILREGLLPDDFPALRDLEAALKPFRKD